MKSFTGTKGKWVAEDEEENGVFIKTESGDAAICRVYTNNRVIQGIEGNENAKLIAASPDLLKSLQTILSLYTGTDKPSVRATLEAQAAINKALGE